MGETGAGTCRVGSACSFATTEHDHVVHRAVGEMTRVGFAGISNGWVAERRRQREPQCALEPAGSGSEIDGGLADGWAVR